MDRKVKVAIIGAGTAGLSAYKEVRKYSSDVIVIDGGPLGSTCARFGCMPSKLLIQSANFYHNRFYFKSCGIQGVEYLSANVSDVLEYVRGMRDKFSSGVIEETESLGEHFLFGNAKFITIDTLKVGDQIIRAENIIIANGAESLIPDDWQNYQEYLLTNKNIFEQRTLSKEIGIIGAGSIGLELAQPLSRLGINISVFSSGEFIGGLSDPEVNKVALDIFRKEYSISLNERVSLAKRKEQLYVQAEKNKAVEQVIVAVGNQSNATSLGLEELGVAFDHYGIPKFDRTTMKIKNCPVFIAGDANKKRALLHEAADEGRIAAYNAIHGVQCFKRRTPIQIMFTDPNIVIVGKAYKELEANSFVVGEIDFSKQGRAQIMHENQGLLRIYGTKEEGLLLGAEMIAPGGEHLGHLLAWAIEQELTVFDLLKMPFYHPVLEEGMRTAIRNLSEKVAKKATGLELAICESEAISPLV
ncbi:MAG: dihydrolipoyl dehydrogenase [Legionellaceae bacterium]|nr:dihydrolipoyl dehydrogenase [Legionellaceae bacterium]